jgi:hypothetical protein
MTKEAKIKQFKYAFGKPKHPDKNALKAKVALEKAVTALKKGKDQNGVLTSSGRRSVNDLLNPKLPEYNPQNKAYLDELLAYKLVKHWDDKEAFDAWLECCSDARHHARAVISILGTKPKPEFVLECWKRFGENEGIANACYDFCPDLLLDHTLEAMKSLPAKMGPRLECNRLKSKVVVSLFDEGKLDKIPDDYRDKVVPEDAIKMAEKSTEQYAKLFLTGVKPENLVAALKTPNVREALAKDKDLWDKLSKEVPMLKFFEDAQKNIKTTGSVKERELSLADAVFKELLTEGNALNLTYYTNNFTRPDDALGAKPEDLDKLVQKKREELNNLGYDDVPDQPAAQCDVLVSILTRVVEGALGPNATVKCKPIVIPEMVLTVPLSQLPGPNKKPGKGGLLPIDFGGNVYLEDAKAPNGQVFFTGNGVELPNAHTYLDVDGVLYDAVLGTSGDDVIKAVADKFAQWEEGWKTKGEAPEKVRVAKSDKGNWIIEEKGLLAAKNSQGFKSGYRLTADISKYAVKDEPEAEAVK